MERHRRPQRFVLSWKTGGKPFFHHMAGRFSIEAVSAVPSSLLRFAHKTSKNRLKRRFFTLQTARRKLPGGNCQKTKFSRSPFIGVFWAFFNEKTIKTYKRNRLLAASSIRGSRQVHDPNPSTHERSRQRSNATGFREEKRLAVFFDRPFYAVKLAFP
jgi:hypothetical protein